MNRTEFFELPAPEYEDHTWVLRDEHGPSSVPPLLVRNRFGGAEAPGELPRSLNLHGFTYVRETGGGDDGPLWGSIAPPCSVADLRYWRGEWLSQVERICLLLEEFHPALVKPGSWSSTLQYQEQAYMRVFGGIHSTAPGPAHAASGAFTNAFLARFGDARREDMHALLQGVPNCSLDRAAALWDLSRILRANPDLEEALDRGSELPDSDAGIEFKAGLEALLAEFGHTSNTDLQDLPVWREDPAIPLAAVRAYAKQEASEGPREAAERQRRRRLDLEAELKQAAKDDPQVAEILRLLPMAQELIPNLEDHNFLADQRMIAASRARWMSIGAFLQSRADLAAADDVFFLRRDELLAALEGEEVPDKEAIASRRQELTQARASKPPPLLGKIPEQFEAESGKGPTISQSETRTIRGFAASPGSRRGRARVIETLEEAATLQQGDVLVVRTTTPPWTPFFGLASAIVTNSGGVLSHAAVVAREMGIPAVVGTRNATAIVETGQMLTVDGSNGLVLLETAV